MQTLGLVAMGPLDHWVAGQASFSALGRGLTGEEAELAVPACPDWTVREVYAHQAGVAADILGGRLDGVTTDPWTARQVAERAERSLTEILDEWDAAAPRLRDALTPLGDDIDPRMVIDLWTHLHDVRGAVDRAGDRVGETADWVARRARAHAERQFEQADLRPAAVGSGGDTTECAVVVDPFELCRAVVGRRSPQQVRAWRWTVADPEPYVALVPVFPPRATDLVEPA